MIKQDKKINEKILLAQPLGSRNIGRSILHWRDEVDKDARMFEIRNWWMAAQDHDEWKGFLEKAKTQR